MRIILSGDKMKIFSVIIISLLSVFALILLLLHIKSRRPIKSAAINALLGIAAIAVINLTFRFTGVRIPLNIYTVPSALVFGIPACAAFIVFQTLM